MINLLPLQEKKEMMTRKRLRLALIFEIGLLLFLISGFSALFSVKAYLGGEINAEKINLAQRQKEVDQETVFGFEKDIEELNQKFERVESFYENQVSLAKVLEQIYENLPSGAYLTSFSSSYGSKINVAGFIPTQEELLVFKKNLEKIEEFEEIDFPLANWVSAKDVEFYFTFKIQ
jgi:Tfp pilus assembly protein PilN